MSFLHTFIIHLLTLFNILFNCNHYIINYSNVILYMIMFIHSFNNLNMIILIICINIMNLIMIFQYDMFINIMLIINITLIIFHIHLILN